MAHPDLLDLDFENDVTNERENKIECFLCFLNHGPLTCRPQ